VINMSADDLKIQVAVEGAFIEVINEIKPVLAAARNLFDNRLGFSEGRNPSAPRAMWAALGEVLYGADDERVKELRK